MFYLTINDITELSSVYFSSGACSSLSVLERQRVWAKTSPIYKSDSLQCMSSLLSLPAVLNVDNSVVDLETIEALYENVSSRVFL